MNKKNYCELMEELYDVTNLLEMCRGYAQSDEPNMKALSESLYAIRCRYEEVYGSLCTYNKANT